MTDWDKKAREIVHARVCCREGDACSVDALQALISLTIRQAVTAEQAENKRLKNRLSKQIDLTDAAEWEAQRLRVALHKARIFIEDEYHSPHEEEWGEWLDKDARGIHSIICDALYPKEVEQ